MTKRLIDKKLFRGQVVKLTMTQLHQNPGDIISQVQMGKTFMITKSGKTVAVLTAPKGDYEDN